MPHAWLNGTFKVVVRDEGSEDIYSYLNNKCTWNNRNKSWGKGKKGKQKSAPGKEC